MTWPAGLWRGLTNVEKESIREVFPYLVNRHLEATSYAAVRGPRWQLAVSNDNPGGG